jgi:hypothetical protein
MAINMVVMGVFLNSAKMQIDKENAIGKRLWPKYICCQNIVASFVF